MDSITRSANDSGFFGKGIYILSLCGCLLFSLIWLYGTTEAEYAHRVYSSEALLVNWMAVFSPLPVIAQDEDKLANNGNYSNYDAHFALVYSPYNAHRVRYHACEYGQQHQYTELVVFNPAQVLPRYIVELQRILIFGPDPHATLSSRSKQAAMWSVDQVCSWAQRLQLSKS
jgi:hypothetical protein